MIFGRLNRTIIMFFYSLFQVRRITHIKRIIRQFQNINVIHLSHFAHFVSYVRDTLLILNNKTIYYFIVWFTTRSSLLKIKSGVWRWRDLNPRPRTHLNKFLVRDRIFITLFCLRKYSNQSKMSIEIVRLMDQLQLPITVPQLVNLMTKLN